MMGSSFSNPLMGSCELAQGDCAYGQIPLGADSKLAARRKRRAKPAPGAPKLLKAAPADESAGSSSSSVAAAATALPPLEGLTESPSRASRHKTPPTQSSSASSSSSLDGGGQVVKEQVLLLAHLSDNGHGNGHGSGSSMGDARSSCSDESAPVGRQPQQADEESRKQRARKRRLQQQRTRKRRLQQQQQQTLTSTLTSGPASTSDSTLTADASDAADANTDAAAALKVAGTATSASATLADTESDQPENKDIDKTIAQLSSSHGGVKTSQHQRKDTLAAVSRPIQQAAQQSSFGQHSGGRLSPGQQIATTTQTTTSSSNASTTNLQTTTTTTTEAAAAASAEQPTNNNDSGGRSATSLQTKQQIPLEKQAPAQDQEPIIMSIGGPTKTRTIRNSNHKSNRIKFTSQLEASLAAASAATATEQHKRTLLSRRLEPQTTTAAAPVNLASNNYHQPIAQLALSSGAAIIDRLIIPAANLNLNHSSAERKQQQQQQQQQQHHPLQGSLFNANYIEQQLEANCCCCWERDPNNRDYCAGQLSHLPHCHDVSQPPRRPWINKSPPFHQQPNQRQAPSNNCPVAAPIRGQRPTIYANNDAGQEFSVLSYNVLCDRMARPHYFPSAPYAALTWSYRRSKILEQLRDFNADIVALQELELEHFESFFRPKLAALNYDGIFEPKSRVRTMDCLDMIRRVDGCAIFYKRNKFRLVQRHLLELRRIAVANANGNQPMINRVMTKDNIGLVAILELLPQSPEGQQRRGPLRRQQSNQSQTGAMIADEEPNRREQILVCNTHIHWNPDDCDVKLIQTIMLMDELGSIARQHNRDRLAQQMIPTATITTKDNSLRLESTPILADDQDEIDMMPLILLGDFNSMPNSGVTDYLTNGEISSLHKDFKDYRYSAIGSPINQLRRQSSPAWCSYQMPPTATTTMHPSPPLTPAPAPAPTPAQPITTKSPALRQHLALGPSLSAFPALALSEAADSTALLSSSPSTSTSSVDSACYSSSSSPLPVLSYSHPFKLTSAYENSSVPFTNFTQQFQAIIDYIFYSSESLQLLGLLGPLDKNWLKANRIRTLPQPHLPSDHLPLLVRFRLNRPTGNGLQPLAEARPSILGGDNNNSTKLPFQSSSLNLSSDNYNRQQQQRPVSMRYNGTLHVGRPLKRQDAKNSGSFAVAMPVNGDKNNPKTLNDHYQQQRHPQTKCYTNQHSRPARTNRHSALANKFDRP